MTRSRFIILLVLLALVGGGAALMLSGSGLPFMASKKAPMQKVVLDPITFAEPFIVNLADTDATHYVKMQVAVQLAPMTEADQAMFLTNKSAGEGGGDPKTGETMLRSDPVLRDAVITTVARFDSATLLTDAGKTKLKHALLAAFESVAVEEQAARGKGKHDPADPPYHVAHVYTPEFAVQ